VVRLTSREIANISVLTALSAAMMLAGFEYSFIYLPYLKFDIAELPVYIIAIFFGPFPAFISTGIIGLIVALRNPVGAVFKFLSILTNGIPLALLIKLPEKTFRSGKDYKTVLCYLWLGGIISVIIRSLLMTIFNYILIEILIGPIEAWASIFGYTVSLLLLLTFVFNIIQGLINVGGAILIVSKLPPEWVPDWLRRSE